MSQVNSLDESHNGDKTNTTTLPSGVSSGHGINSVVSQGRFSVGIDNKVVDSFVQNRVLQERAAITCCVNEKVWPFKKFIVHESELDLGSKLQKVVCRGLHIRSDEVESFWNRNRETVRNALTRKRNNTMEAIRNRLKSESHDCEL